MSPTRRLFLSGALAASLVLGRTNHLRIGITDWSLKRISNLEAVAPAAELGFEGVQGSSRMQPVGGKLLLDNDELIRSSGSELTGGRIVLNGTWLAILHANHHKNDQFGEKLAADRIGLRRNPYTRVMLLPFLGRDAVKAKQEQDATQPSVILGLENTISARENAAITDRDGSAAVGAYYDANNETFWLRRQRLPQIDSKAHPPYFSEGQIEFISVMTAIDDSGSSGPPNLETDTTSGDVSPDVKRNLSYLRRVMTEG